MKDADLSQVLGWRNHPSIRKYMYTQHEISPEEHSRWWAQVKDSPRSRFFLFEHACQTLGYVAFTDIVPDSATATWGFYTSPEAPKGTGSQMAFAAMDCAFETLGLRKVSSEALGCNTASIRLHESFGFQREGVFRAHVLIGDRFDDVMRFALFAEDWAKLRPAKLQTLTERLSL